ncbi:MAG: hypothetical protein K0S07_477 [Chlamydiales bacterium]|jgi:hypothetical protein|nr:hypothetical protein [Chlamydiales bacterium]
MHCSINTPWQKQTELGSLEDFLFAKEDHFKKPQNGEDPAFVELLQSFKECAQPSDPWRKATESHALFLSLFQSEWVREEILQSIAIEEQKSRNRHLSHTINLILSFYPACPIAEIQDQLQKSLPKKWAKYPILTLLRAGKLHTGLSYAWGKIERLPPLRLKPRITKWIKRRRLLPYKHQLLEGVKREEAIWPAKMRSLSKLFLQIPLKSEAPQELPFSNGAVKMPLSKDLKVLIKPYTSIDLDKSLRKGRLFKILEIAFSDLEERRPPACWRRR